MYKIKLKKKQKSLLVNEKKKRTLIKYMKQLLTTINKRTK